MAKKNPRDVSMKGGSRSPISSLPWLLALSFAGTLAYAADPANQYWPQWRGPACNGVAPLGDPPTSWGDGTNIQWKTRIPGKGSSTPIIWEQDIYIQAAVEKAMGNGTPPTPAPGDPAAPERGSRGGGMARAEKPSKPYQFQLICLDRSSGGIKWQKTLREEVPQEGHHPDHGYASHSPVTDGRSVYAYFGSRGLHCVDRNGEVKWQKDLGKMSTRNSFGEGSSPALFRDRIFVNWDHQGDDFIAAFDKVTGKEIWRQPREEDTSWSTPLVVEHSGKTQVVVAATKKVRSYDFETGKLLWECGGLTANVIPTPVAKDGFVYPISGFRGSALFAVRLGKEGDLTGTDAIAWSYNKNTPYVPSPLLLEEHLYFFAGNNANLTCLDARDGKVLMDSLKIEGMSGVYASPVAAAGRVYLASRNGTTVVVKQGDKLEILATNRLEDRFDASPAIVGKQLFLRGQEYLYCIAGR